MTAERLSAKGIPACLLSIGTAAACESVGTEEEKGVGAAGTAGAASGVGRAAAGVTAKGLMAPVTAGAMPILGDAEDCPSRKKGAAAPKLLPALPADTEEPKLVSPRGLLDPKIEGFWASEEGFEKPNEEDGGTDKGAGVKVDPMGCVNVLDRECSSSK